MLGSSQLSIMLTPGNQQLFWLPQATAHIQSSERERKRDREGEGRKREREGDRHRETKKSNIDHIFGIRSGPNDDGGGAGVLEVRKGRKKFFLGMLIEDTKIERPTR